MTMTNFEMEPAEAPTPPPAKVFVPCWAKLMLVGLLVLSVYTLIRAEASVEAQADMQFSINQIKKELTWTKEKRELLKRVAAAEKGEKALKAELGRVYANLQGKNYTPPADPEDDGEDRPKSPAPFDYNSCTEDEHLALCALVQQDRESIIQTSRKCAGWFWKKNKFKKCFMEAIPELSDHCAMCFVDAGDYGYNNSKSSCITHGPTCEGCMQKYAEDARKCMGFLLPGYALPYDCPVKEGPQF